MIVARTGLALLAIFLSGAGPAAWLSRRSPVPLGLFLGRCYVLGFGTGGLACVLAMMAGLRWGPWPVLVTAAVGLLVLVRWRPAFVPPEPADGWSRACLALAAGVSVLVLFWAIARGDLGWDGEVFWSIKSRSIERFGTFRNPDFTGDGHVHPHPRYPLLVPSIHAWIYAATGSASARPVRLAMALLFVGSLPWIRAWLRERVSSRWAAALTAAYALTPALNAGHEGGAASGYADYPLAIFMTLAVVEARRWVSTGDAAAGVLAAAALAIQSQIKDDGMAFVPVMGVVLAVSVVRGPGAVRPAAVAALLAPALAAAGAWAAHTAFLARDPAHLSFPPEFHPSRIPYAVGILGWTLLQIDRWPLLWPLAGAAFLTRFPRLRDPESLLFWSGAGMFAVYFGVWICWPGPLDAFQVMKHMVTRMVLHLYPIFFLWTAGRLLATSGSGPAGGGYSS